jgi:nitrogen fixation protein NifU and related proteins
MENVMNAIIEEHFMNPKNIGYLELPDLLVSISDPVCGDTVNMEFKTDAYACVEEVCYHAYGCSTSLATASIISELVKGKTREELIIINRSKIAELLGDLAPKEKHCIDIGFAIIQNLTEQLWKKTQKDTNQ